MSDFMFKKLSKKQEAEFRGWARSNYVPGTKVDELWHPVVRDECAKINREAGKEP